MEQANIRELIIYKKSQNLRLSQEELATARKYMSEREINHLVGIQVSPKGCFNLSQIREREYTKTKPIE